MVLKKTFQINFTKDQDKMFFKHKNKEILKIIF
jgi:hypothetical protein